jgi:hypothetical protein
MTKVYPVLRKVCWGLGVISLILGLLLKIVTSLTAVYWRFSTRGAILLAAVLFLCVLATREMEHTGSSG